MLGKGGSSLTLWRANTMQLRSSLPISKLFSCRTAKRSNNASGIALAAEIG